MIAPKILERLEHPVVLLLVLQEVVEEGALDEVGGLAAQIGGDSNDRLLDLLVADERVSDRVDLFGSDAD